MSVIDVNNLSFGYTDHPLFQDASMRLFEGEHAVLVGPNGTGKSTLLKLLYRSIKPDAGSIENLPHRKIGYLDQYAKLEGSKRVGEYLKEVFAALFEKEARMEALYLSVASLPEEKQPQRLNQAAILGEQLIESDFYNIKAKIGKILTGLGLSTDLLDKPIKHLSGGMRAKIILGKLLLEEADILLLDEPTNFLDVKHIEWLTKFLVNYPKAFIVASHHEAFLSDIAATVLALENHKIVRYKGNYKLYLDTRTLRQEQHQKAFVAQQKLIDRTEVFIQKNITRAKTTKRAQSRRKMLEKLDRIAAPKKDRYYRFHFPVASSTGRDVIAVNDLEIGYDFPLTEPLTMTIMKEEKVAVTGMNGIGKSTFIKTLLGRIPELGGTYQWIDTAKIAYFEQDSLTGETITPFQLIHERYPRFTRRDILALLGSHGIDFDKAHQTMPTLSGGEQTKVRLALLRHQRANVLILDEPTNHLDIKAKEALKEALIDYKGTLILVSHEKAFYQDVCDYEIGLYGEE